MAVRRSSCERKNPYSRDTARSVADSVNAELDGRAALVTRQSAYHCSFCGRWHTGALASIDDLQRVATAMRVLAGNAPGPAEPPTMAGDTDDRAR